MTPIVGVFLYDKTFASKIFARKCEILNIFLIISGSHLGLSPNYHIPIIHFGKKHGFYGGHFEIGHNDQLVESSIGNLIET